MQNDGVEFATMVAGMEGCHVAVEGVFVIIESPQRTLRVTIEKPISAELVDAAMAQLRKLALSKN